MERRGLYPYLWGLLLLCMACGESSDEGEAPEPEIPTASEFPYTAFRSIETSEVQHSDAQAVTLIRTFGYNGEGKIVSYTMCQRYQAVEAVEMKRTTTVSHGEGTVVVTEETGNSYTYTLNDNRRAATCLWQSVNGSQRHYAFSYHTSSTGTPLLKSVTETLQGETQPFASIEVDYDEATPIVTQSLNGATQSHRLTLATGAAGINTATLPPLFLSELYPLSEHLPALYGKLLGEPLPFLVEQVTPIADNDGNESITYTYSLNEEGLPITIKAVTTSYGNHFTREIETTFND